MIKLIIKAGIVDILDKDSLLSLRHIAEELVIDHILQLLLYLQIHRHILLHRTGHIRKICLASVVKQTCQRHLRHIISRHRLTTALDAMLTHREKFWKMSVRTHHHRESMRNVLDAKLVLLRFKCIKLNFCVSCHAVFHFYPSPQPSTMLLHG